MDHRRTLAPGELIQIKTAGDYIYCKWADRPVRVLIDGEPVEMMTGDKHRPAGGFDNFEVENRDGENPIAVIFTVGRGDYNRQIIQGEITVAPGVRGADGLWRDDTRNELTVDVYPLRSTSRAYPIGSPIHMGPALKIREYGGYRVEERGYCLAPSSVGFCHLVLVSTISHGIFEPNDGHWEARHYSRSMTPIKTTRHPAPAGGGGDALSVPRDIAFFRGREWVVCSTSDSQTVGLAEGLTNPALRWESPYGEPLKSIGATPFGMVILDVAGHWFVMGHDGIIREIARPAWDTFANINTAGCVRWDFARGVGYACSDTSAVKTFDENVEFIEEIDLVSMTNSGALGDGFVPFGRFYAVQGPSPVFGAAIDEGRAGILPWREVVTPAEIHVERAGCSGAWIADDRTDSFLTAAVTLTPGAGASVIAGEVIRAALEQYFGQPVGDGYMDHVYRFQASGNAVGGNALIREGGSRTLAARGVHDDLVVPLPARITVTIDDDLPLL